eukprot:gene8333-biopygen1588
MRCPNTWYLAQQLAVGERCTVLQNEAVGGKQGEGNTDGGGNVHCAARRASDENTAGRAQSGNGKTHAQQQQAAARAPDIEGKQTYGTNADPTKDNEHTTSQGGTAKCTGSSAPSAVCSMLVGRCTFCLPHTGCLDLPKSGTLYSSARSFCTSLV